MKITVCINEGGGGIEGAKFRKVSEGMLAPFIEPKKYWRKSMVCQCNRKTVREAPFSCHKEIIE